MSCVSVIKIRFPSKLRAMLDDARYFMWERTQNGNATLQSMAGDLAIMKDELETALDCAKDGECAQAAQLIESALDTLTDHQNTIRERL